MHKDSSSDTDHALEKKIWTYFCWFALDIFDEP